MQYIKNCIHIFFVSFAVFTKLHKTLFYLWFNFESIFPIDTPDALLSSGLPTEAENPFPAWTAPACAWPQPILLQHAGYSTMPTPSLPPLSPQRHKELRNRHPLYKRLSGESVWVFLEELGLDEAQCELFMDAFFRQMDHILACMDALESDPRQAARITGSAEACCTACAACTGRRLLPDSDPAYGDLLPPFGIGCPLLLQLEDAGTTPQRDDVSALPHARRPLQEEHSVLCAGLAADPQGGLERFLEALRELPSAAVPA